MKILNTVEWILLLVIRFLVAVIPLCMLYAISSFFSRLVLLIKFIPINKISQRNLRRAFPEKSPKQIRKICYRYYCCVCDYLIEFIKRTHFSDEEMMVRCHFENLDLLVEKFKNHQFVICYGGHMLNFEWQVSLPLHLPDYGMCHLFLSGESGKVTEWILKTRSQYGAINIPTSSPIKPILKIKKELDTGINLHKGYVFGTLADMDTTADNPHVSPFFNHDLEMLTGSERIGRKLNMAFVYACMRRTKRGYYSIELMEMVPPDVETNPYAYTDEFVRLLEQNIREQPELWLQWGDCRF